jgi:hypothetical protein
MIDRVYEQTERLVIDVCGSPIEDQSPRACQPSARRSKQAALPSAGVAHHGYATAP